ncbi:MAG: phosphatidylserine/phosphatidylglycerophosphate/cardiolipin synthase family protein [Haloferacaceae archaeon]
MFAARAVAAVVAAAALLVPTVAAGVAPSPAVDGPLASAADRSLPPAAAPANVTPSPRTGPPTGPPRDGPSPAVVAVRPNPVADGDAGEFVVVDPDGVPDLVLADGEATVPVPPADDPVALAADPAAARPLTDRRVVPAADLGLANGGERLRLRRDGRTVDAVAYEDAPEAERYAGGRWLPYGFEPRSVHAYGPADATAFLLPDSPGVVHETLRSADRRILVGGYTLTSGRVVDALVAAARRGVRVRVLLEGGPVGGLSRREAAALDRLTRADVAVRLVDGPRARFSFHHPKYAVVDDRALVLTENWDPGGVGGRDNRGWGVRVDSARVAGDLAALFARDFGAHDARPWRVVRRNASLQSRPVAEGSYPTRFDPERVRAERVRVVTAPGNAERAVVGVIDGATRRVDVLQPSVGGLDGPFVRASLRAAGRGVRVRILLSGAWYAEEENRATVERLNALADRRDLPLEARLADPNGRYGTVHAKGVIADDTVVVGSLNWNVHSARENREVALVLDGERVASYYRDAFDADWRGGRPSVPLTLVAVVLVALGLVVAVVRRRVAFR